MADLNGRAVTQMQWSFGITHMPAGQNLIIGGQNPLNIDYGPYAVQQSPYGQDTTGGVANLGYVVPAGHVLGLTTATLEQKFAWRGNYHLPTMRLRAPGFVAPFNGSAIAYPDQAFTLEPIDGSRNAEPCGIDASSYLVLAGIGTVMDWEGCRRWTPPLLLGPGTRLYFVVSNNHGGQNMGFCVQGLLAEILADEGPADVFPRLGVMG